MRVISMGNAAALRNLSEQKLNHHKGCASNLHRLMGGFKSTKTGHGVCQYHSGYVRPENLNSNTSHKMPDSKEQIRKWTEKYRVSLSSI